MIDLIFLGSPRKELKPNIDELMLRSSRYHAIQCHYIESTPSRRNQQIKRILANSRWIVGLDERGKQYNSLEFGDALQTWLEVYRNVAFIVGDAFSLPGEIQYSDFLSLSKMTFPHDVARLLLAEQVYRGLTISNRHPYHHA